LPKDIFSGLAIDFLSLLLHKFFGSINANKRASRAIKESLLFLHFSCIPQDTFALLHHHHYRRRRRAVLFIIVLFPENDVITNENKGKKLKWKNNRNHFLPFISPWHIFMPISPLFLAVQCFMFFFLAFCVTTKENRNK
jgi:hypothetical protein